MGIHIWRVHWWYLVCHLNFIRGVCIKNILRQFHGAKDPITDLHQVDDHFLKSFMILMVRVARTSNRALGTIVRAGYLDAMLSLEKQGFFPEKRIDALDAFRFPLAVLRYLWRSLYEPFLVWHRSIRSSVLFTQEQIIVALDLLFLYLCRWRIPDLPVQVEGLAFICDTMLPQLVMSHLV